MNNVLNHVMSGINVYNVTVAEGCELKKRKQN